MPLAAWADIQPHVRSFTELDRMSFLNDNTSLDKPVEGSADSIPRSATPLAFPHLARIA